MYLNIKSVFLFWLITLAMEACKLLNKKNNNKLNVGDGVA